MNAPDPDRVDRALAALATGYRYFRGMTPEEAGDLCDRLADALESEGRQMPLLQQVGLRMGAEQLRRQANRFRQMGAIEVE